MLSRLRCFLHAAGQRVGLHPFYLMVTFGSVFCLLGVATTAWMVWEQRQAAIDRASVNLRNLSLAVADQTERVIESLELAEDRLLGHMDGNLDTMVGKPIDLMDSQRLHVVMRDIIFGMSQAYALLLVDENGDLVSSSRQWPIAKLNYADRAYFQFARDHPETTRFVGGPIVSREAGRATFPVVRRLSGPDGSFRGLINGSIEVGYLERLFGISTLPDGSVALFRSDGVMLARNPAVPIEAARGLEAEFRAMPEKAGTGVVRRKGLFDGVDRLTSVSNLSKHQLKVVVSESFDALIAPWRIEAIWIGGIAGLGTLATAITVFMAIRRFHDRQRLEAAISALRFDEERKRADQVIAEQHAEFGLALDKMSQGLMMFDVASRLRLANSAMHTIFAFQPDSLRRGMSVADIVNTLAGTGSILPQHVDGTINFYLSLAERRVPKQFVRKLFDGRLLAGNLAPYDKGWILTFEDITEARKADERIAHMALHDALTGLPNRVMLRTRTEEALTALQDGRTFAIVCLDLDQFKDVNDTLGHSAGDKLLCEVAKRIQSATRQSDIVARLGGDEFAIVVSPAGRKEAIDRIAVRLVEAITAPFRIDGQMVNIGASIGIAVAPEDGADPDSLMKSADLALYRAKSEGRGRFVFFAPAMEQHVLERRRIERELHEALSMNEFQLYYQPLVAVSTRRIAGFEALLRWRHPTRWLVSPMEFVTIAEENGFIVQIGAWALNEACLEAVQWPGDLKVAVNLSPVQFRSGKLVQTVADALAVSGLPPNRLELEITETAMMNDTDATIATLRELKALGVRIAMDDFGTGYSSLAYLQKFPFDKIKIDRAFVRDIRQATNLAIVHAVTAIAASMGIGTTAEGVETEDQFTVVAGARCNEAQGYLFSRPCPAEQAMALVAREHPPAPKLPESMAPLVGYERTDALRDITFTA